MRHQSGYTLLEVLIASAIFVAVLVIATGTFATASRLRDRTLASQATTETARFIAETLSRDIRAATGTKQADQYTALPFSFMRSGVVVASLTSGRITGDGLKTVRFDPSVDESGATSTRLYTFSSSDGGQLLVSKDGGAAESLAPAGFTVTDGQFTGISHGVVPLRVQPYVQFQFTVTNLESGASQTIRSAVTSRELLQQ